MSVTLEMNQLPNRQKKTERRNELGADDDDGKTFDEKETRQQTRAQLA